LWLVEDDELEFREFDGVSVQDFVVDSSIEELEFFNFGDILAEDNLSVLVVEVRQNLLNAGIGVD
jgi:hypothetical protein